MSHSAVHYPLAYLIVGILLLLAGRRLFWLFVAAAGFLAGAAVAPYILPHQSDAVTLVLALVLGIGGALLAIFLQKLAIAIGGFVAGGYLAAYIAAPLLGGNGVTYPGAWICFLVGGVLGAILLLAFFNCALIVLSSLEGAHMVVRGLPVMKQFPDFHRYHGILFVVLAVLGILIQFGTNRRKRIPPS